jgi:transposase
MSAIEIARRDPSISQMRAEAARTADAKKARRILAIAMVLDGHSRLVAEQAGGMDRQTLRDWVIRYNANGLAGLADRPRPKRQPCLAEAAQNKVAKWVEAGPDLATDGVVHWRCLDMRDRIAAEFNVHLHERSVGKLLKKLDFSSISVRPLHPQNDIEAQGAFKICCGPRVLRVMAWPCREVANPSAARPTLLRSVEPSGRSAHLPQLVAERRFRNRDAEFLENPLRQIVLALTHDAMDGRIGPSSILCRKAWRWWASRRRRAPGVLPVRRPSGPFALNRTTQSSTICKVTPPIRAASEPEPPS